MLDHAAAPAAHSHAMEQALARAPSRDGWLATPELPWDYRVAQGLPYEPFGEAGRDRPALESLARITALLPDHPACEDEAGARSFAALQRDVGRLAAAIRRSPAPGPVGILLPNGVCYPVAVLACLAAGRLAVLLDAGFPEERNAALIRLTGAGLLIVAEARRAQAARHGLPCIAADVVPAGGEDAFPPAQGWLGQDAPAFILCTSGSTGQPKAIVHSQRSVLHRVGGLIDAMHLSARDRFLCPTSGVTIAGLAAMFVMLSGCTLQPFALDDGGLRGLLARLREGRATVLRGSPSLFRLLVRLPDAAALLGGVRALRIGGEPLLQADVAALGRCLPPGHMICTGYGSTEMPGTSWIARAGDAQDPVRVAAGVLDPGTEAKIVDGEGRPCPPGEAGELWLRSRHAALGEWRDGTLLPGRLEPDPSDPTWRIYRTGDLARLSPDGVFMVLGRMDRMVKMHGWRVEPAEVETALRRSPEVAQAAVIAQDAGGRTALVAFVVPVAGAAAGLEHRLRALLAEALPEAMRPARILALDALPLLPGGKRDEMALARLLAA